MFTKERVRELMKGFLQGTSSGEIKRAEAELMAYSRSKECLHLSLELVAEGSKSERLLASKFLKDKVQYDFYQMEEAEVVGLHNRIKGQVESTPEMERGVKQNFSLCIVYIYMRMYKSIGPLIDYLRANFSSPSHFEFLFMVLAALPGELSNKVLVIDSLEREEVTLYAQSLQQTVLGELQALAGSWPSFKREAKALVLECFREWVRIHYHPACYEGLVSHFLLSVALDEFFDSTFKEIYAGILENIFDEIEDVEQVPGFIKFVASRVVAILQAVASRAGPEQDLEAECSMVSSFGAVACREFIRNPEPSSLQFLKLLVSLLQKMQSESVVQFFLEFGARLKSGGKSKREYFKQVLKSLTFVLLNQVAYSAEHFAQLQTYDRDYLAGFFQVFESKEELRKKVKKLLKKIEFLLEVEEIEEVLAKVNEFVYSSMGKPQFERMTQATLTLLCPLVSSAVSKHILIPVFSLLQKCQPTHYALRRATTRLIKHSAELLKDSPQLYKWALQFLLGCIAEGSLRRKASKTFKILSLMNSDFIVKNMAFFIGAVEGDSCDNELISAISTALARSNEAVAGEHFKRLLTHIIKLLDLSLEGDFAKADEQLQKFEKIVGCLGECSLAVELFGELWQRVVKCFNHGETNLVQKACKFVKVAMRTLKRSFERFLGPVFEEVSTQFAKNPLSSYLYLVEVMITVYNGFPEFLDRMKGIYEYFVLTTFRLFEASEVKDELLVSDFFGMNLRCLRFCEHMLLSSQHFELLLRLALQWMNIEEREASYSIHSTTQHLLLKYCLPSTLDDYNKEKDHEASIAPIAPNSAYYERVKVALSQFVGPFVAKAVKFLEQVPFETIRKYVTTSLCYALEAFPQEGSDGLTLVLCQVGEQILIRTEKERLCKMVLARESKAVKKLVKRFCERCLNQKLRAP